MRLGNFFIRTGVLSHQQLIAALAIQNQRRKFLPLLAVEQGFLAPEDALSCWENSQEKGQDYLTFLLENNKISETGKSQLFAKWCKSALPLGLLLVELAYISEEERLACLDEFLKYGRNE